MTRPSSQLAFRLFTAGLVVLAVVPLSCLDDKLAPVPDMAQPPAPPPPADMTAMAPSLADAAVADVMARTSFVALVTDFANFQSWTRVEIPSSKDPIVGAHQAGPRYVYINYWRLPPGTQSFPVGTIIVKTAGEDTSPSDKTKWEIHAMTKRATTGWNGTGAVDWEWWDLAFNAAGELVMNWRGVKPPAEGGYPCATLPGQPVDPNAGDCNTCHTSKGTANDYVISSPLILPRDGGP